MVALSKFVVSGGPMSARVLGSLSMLGLAAAVTLATGVPAGFAQEARSAQRPLYKDASQPIERRVEDLLARMTLEEKTAQLITIWEHKDKIQTDAGAFSPAEASQNFPQSLGQIARPSD